MLIQIYKFFETPQKYIFETEKVSHPLHHTNMQQQKKTSNAIQ